MRTILQHTLLPLLALLIPLGCVLVLGQAATLDLHQRPRYQTAFEDLHCDPPAPMQRQAFLREVQYEADAPAGFSRLDPLTPQRVQAWFLKHPWVAAVDRVVVHPRGGVEVKLRYREPVLTVQGPERLHAVCADGILLPRAVPLEGLPRLRGRPAPPCGPGRPWGSAAVLAAARTAGLLRHSPTPIDLASLEVAQDEVILWTRPGSRIVWGRAPASEVPGEPSARVKQERLQTSLAAIVQSPLPVEIDLRPPSGALRRVLVADNDDHFSR